MRKRITLAITFVLALAIQEARAVTYSYQGNPFTAIVLDQTPPVGSYDTSMSVTGYFTLAAPLAPDLNFVFISPNFLDVSFNDGRNTITSASTGFLTTGAVTTNAIGQLIAWDFHFRTSDGFTDRDIYVSTSNGGGGDFGSIAECISFFFSCTAFRVDFARNFEPGTWSVTNVTTPVPAALPLFASGLAVLGWAARRRRRLALL